MMRVYFYAKVGDLNQKPYGGGEVGNRRTLKMLQEIGYDVRLIPRYYNYEEKSLWVFMKIIFGDILSLFRLFLCLAFRSRKKAVVHISGYTGAYLPIELLSLLISKVLCFKVIYEIRGGGIVEAYFEHGLIYKWMFKTAVKVSDNVFSQGNENKSLITSFNNSTSFFYYPNCIEENNMPVFCPKKYGNPVKCVYIGRLAPFKNVDMVLKIIKEVYDRGINICIDVIGEGVDFPAYANELESFVKSNKMTSYCNFKGYLTKDEMKSYLIDATFFIFPSNEKREGQSNALTEAMSFGVIPLVSNKGFSAGVIGCDELVFKFYRSEDYSEKIVEILQNQRVSELSNKMYLRIKNNYLYSKIREQMKNEYIKLFDI